MAEGGVRIVIVDTELAANPVQGDPPETVSEEAAAALKEGCGVLGCGLAGELSNVMDDLVSHCVRRSADRL